MKPSLLEVSPKSLSTQIYISSDIDGEPFGLGIFTEFEFAFAKLNDQATKQLIMIQHQEPLGCAMW